MTDDIFTSHHAAARIRARLSAHVAAASATAALAALPGRRSERKDAPPCASSKHSNVGSSFSDARFTIATIASTSLAIDSAWYIASACACIAADASARVRLYPTTAHLASYSSRSLALGKSLRSGSSLTSLSSPLHLSFSTARRTRVASRTDRAMDPNTALRSIASATWNGSVRRAPPPERSPNGSFPTLNR
eukprot:29787-Pelagococcus_subviridis.AAC.2